MSFGTERMEHKTQNSINCFAFLKILMEPNSQHERLAIFEIVQLPLFVAKSLSIENNAEQIMVVIVNYWLVMLRAMFKAHCWIFVSRDTAIRKTH